MATQNAQMLAKIEVVDEVQTRLARPTASIVSEYRGLTVAELAELRAALDSRRRRLPDLQEHPGPPGHRRHRRHRYQPLTEYLSGPTALTFVDGDVSAVAKALRDFARTNPLLVIKGGLADGSLLSASDLSALADLPPRDVLLARIAGALAAPMQQMAGLLQALPRNLAYGISALIEQKGGAPEAAPEEAPLPRPTRPRLAETRPQQTRPAPKSAPETEAPLLRPSPLLRRRG